MLDKLKSIVLGGQEFLPIVEGSKGIGLTTGFTAGHFALNNAIGTFSAVNPDILDDNGNIVEFVVKAKNRLERHLESVEHTIKAIISQAKRARDIAGTKGRIHMNALWEMGSTEYVLNEAFSKAKGLIQGIVCGAGMPYKLGEIAAKYKVNYFPIVSSMRAFKILWKRSYEKTKEWLGAVVYECPWRAGGHNGLSNAEDPKVPGNTYERVRELRSFMNTVGLEATPIIVAGGVWNLSEYENFLDNKEIGNVAFQFGTRPMVTVENPLSMENKLKLLNLKEGDVLTNKFSPTGFYSSAVNTPLLQKLFARSDRQTEYSLEKTEIFAEKIIDEATKKEYFVKSEDLDDVKKWQQDGNVVILPTPDGTIVFVSRKDNEQIKQDKLDCYGCLSQCQYSCWSQHTENHNSGLISDPRKFCIQKALQYTKSGTNPDEQLLFAGSCATRFRNDPMYANNHIPTTKELIEALIEGR